MWQEHVEEIFAYRAADPKKRNGRDVNALFRANMLVHALDVWCRDPPERKQLEQQGYREIVERSGVLYPGEVLAELYELKQKHADCFRD